jgi:hypothetical protein
MNAPSGVISMASSARKPTPTINIPVRVATVAMKKTETGVPDRNAPANPEPIARVLAKKMLVNSPQLTTTPRMQMTIAARANAPLLNGDITDNNWSLR